MCDTYETEHLPNIAPSASRSDRPWGLGNENVYRLVLAKRDDDMTISTILSVLTRGHDMIGAKAQSLAATFVHCLACFEAPLARRPAKAPFVIVHTNLQFLQHRSAPTTVERGRIDHWFGMKLS